MRRSRMLAMHSIVICFSRVIMQLLAQMLLLLDLRFLFLRFHHTFLVPCSVHPGASIVSMIMSIAWTFGQSE
jgi:hypothetical protein